jgi:predicted small secreted protein
MRLVLLALSAAALLGACNTVEGFGRDLGTLGDALTGASQQARDGGSDELDGGPGSRRRP